MDKVRWEALGRVQFFGILSPALSQYSAFVCKLIDGAWMTMCQGIWLSYGHVNISEEPSMRFARKIRETTMMYFHGVDGAFAAYCQKRFNMHRLPFYGASSLAKWEVGSPATTTPSTEGKQMHFC
jgi:hypothetical protein